MKYETAGYDVIGGLLVISGMVLNTLLSGDAEFDFITCKGLTIKEGLTIKDGYKVRGFLGLDTDGDAMLKIFRDHGKTIVAYLGANAETNEMMLQLNGKSQTDKRRVRVMIDGNGGRFDSNNKMGESVVRIGVVDDGGGIMGTTDKFGIPKEGLGGK